jgi:hypothetical protein
MRPLAACLLVGVLGCLPGCHKPQHYQTTVEVLELRRVGRDPKAPPITDLELQFVDCPGDARKVIRGDKTFGACAAGVKQGDRLAAEVVLTYSSERGTYRNNIVRLGNCPIKLDPSDAANYDRVQECRDVTASGLAVGVRCSRSRSPEMLAKCPWLRRR